MDNFKDNDPNAPELIEAAAEPAKERPDYEVAKEELQSLIEANNLVTNAVFVPRSKSRDPKAEMVNWKVTLYRFASIKPGSVREPNQILKHHSAYCGLKELITTDYSQGVAHLKGYKHFAKKTSGYADEIAHVLETGKRQFGWGGYGFTPVAPSDVDVVSALAFDSDVLDYSEYEEFASDMGYEPDSRKGEKIYKECLKIALKMRSQLGDQLLTKIRELSRRL